MSARRLWLVRHPPVAVERGICYGRSDVALAAPVAAAAATLRDKLPLGATILSSPLRRCAELARALSDTVTFDHRLQEMDFGEWEMRRYGRKRQRHPGPRRPFLPLSPAWPGSSCPIASHHKT